LLTNILQPTHMLIVLIIALVILGPKRLPDAGRALGQGLKEFRSSISGERADAEVFPSRPPAHHGDPPPALHDCPLAGTPTAQRPR
jgi:sec-independent protein translocase protein TatA